MPFDTVTFWVSVAGAAIPSLAVSIVTWTITSRTNRSLAKYQAQLIRDSEALRAWQARRVEALIEVYDTFREHLDFLRREFYGPRGTSQSMDKFHSFRNRLDKVRVFFDEDAEMEIRNVEGELLEFWNWAVSNPHESDNFEEVRRRLDFEIPRYLDRIRYFINREAVRAPRLDRVNQKPLPQLNQR